MRKYQQTKIMDSLQMLDEALTELSKKIDNNIIVSLLADCQLLAVQVSQYIEVLEGEGTNTVALLEKYCELLFKASNGEIGVKILRKHLIKVFNSARSEFVPNRIEIAFLSYNASMSDSILSIYHAAKSDSSCDAYWIPIPYFKRNTDGSFGEMCYEGQECYPHIKCTDWREYDMEKQRPDVIFTFNPYDSDNYVTSVHPDFYCERLRGSTDLLVYVPYFVVSGNILEHFVLTSGCIYAHKVILQSERIRDAYVRIFKEKFGDKFGKPEEKFLALGSPKFDAVINTRREDCVLPDEWRKLIDGKKVILYNTSISAILNGDKQYLNKLRHVLNGFRNRSDVVLWWRPHPLSKATFGAMRPSLLDEYEQLIAEYKNGNKL